MMQFADKHNTPDSPAKVGVPGVYRLAVSASFQFGSRFRYNLVDGEGNHYTTISKHSFQKNQLVRCSVQFSSYNSVKRVSQIDICKKQDIDDAALTLRKVNSIPNPGYIPTDYPFREGSPRQMNITGSYRFSVELSMQCPGGIHCKYVYLLIDCQNQKYHAVSNIKYEKGEKLVCRVEVLKEGAKRKFFLTISDDESSQAVCMIDHRLVLRKNYTPNAPVTHKTPLVVTKDAPKKKRTPVIDDEPDENFVVHEKPEPVFNRKAAEIFESLKASGFHKCGKQFVCSCCGRQYYENQGIKSDTKEIYLCNSCRGSMRKRERQSNSVYAISTPMGNKR